jgi:hypothetical protein
MLVMNWLTLDSRLLQGGRDEKKQGQGQGWRRQICSRGPVQNVAPQARIAGRRNRGLNSNVPRKQDTSW